jgi:hypothetical protein
MQSYFLNKPKDKEERVKNKLKKHLLKQNFSIQ